MYPLTEQKLLQWWPQMTSLLSVLNNASLYSVPITSVQYLIEAFSNTSILFWLYFLSLVYLHTSPTCVVVMRIALQSSSLNTWFPVGEPAGEGLGGKPLLEEGVSLEMNFEVSKGLLHSWCSPFLLPACDQDESSHLFLSPCFHSAIMNFKPLKL